MTTRPRLRRLVALVVITKQLIPPLVKLGQNVTRGVVSAYRAGWAEPVPKPDTSRRDAARARVRRYRTTTAEEMIEFWLPPSSLRAAVHGITIIAQTTQLPEEEVFNMARGPWKIEEQWPFARLFAWSQLKRLR